MNSETNKVILNEITETLSLPWNMTLLSLLTGTSSITQTGIVFFLIYCMFHILTVHISRVWVLAASKYQQIFDSPLTRCLEEMIKAFRGKRTETMVARML